LHKTQLELLSYGKVINVLQEEIKNLEHRLYPDCISQSEYGEVQLQRLKTENNWTQVNAYKNKMLKDRNDNLIPSTTNKFETLNNLEEDEEMIRSASKQEEYVSTRGFQIKTKKKQIAKIPEKTKTQNFNIR
jgi:hypothetical protein